MKGRLNVQKHIVHCEMAEAYMHVSVILKSSVFDQCFPSLHHMKIHFTSAFSFWRLDA